MSDNVLVKVVEHYKSSLAADVNINIGIKNKL